MISESKFQDFLVNARQVTVYVSDGNNYVIIKNFKRNNPKSTWVHGSLLKPSGIDTSHEGERTSVKNIYNYLKNLNKPYHTVTVFANKRKLTVN